MWEVWETRKRRSGKFKRRDDIYSWKDIFLDIMLWVPEVLLLPFRLLYVLGKIVMYVFRYVLDGF